MERPSRNDLSMWRGEKTTKQILTLLEAYAQDTINRIIAGNYNTFSAIEKARGTIEGLRMMEQITRGED